MVSRIGGRYAHIDAMRAIAVLLVVWTHVAESFAAVAGDGQWLHALARDWRFGTIGVALFFLVSGFVIPSGLNPGGARSEQLRRFAVRRFFRLYPAYWLSILLALITTYWVWGRGVDVVTLAANVTMLQHLFGLADIQGLYWTLFVELGFYGICSALFALGVLHNARVLIGVCIAFALVHIAMGAHDVLSPVGPLGFLYELDFAANLSLMFAGALLRCWHDRLPMERWVKGLLAALLVVSMLPLTRSLPEFEAGFSWRLAGGGGEAMAVLVFLCLAMGLRVQHPTLSWLGQISYSIYLLHPVTFYGLLWLLTQPGMGWIAGHNLAVYLGINATLVIGFSSITYLFLEHPMIDLGSRLSRPAQAGGEAQPAPQLHA